MFPVERLVPILLLSTLAVLPGCRQEAPSTDNIRTVLVQVVEDAPMSGIALAGEVRARHEVELAFRVGGKITARLADTGSEIRAGQALARLDPADLQLAASASAAQLAAAESELATSAAEQRRYAELLSKNFVSQAAYDARQNALNSASARLEQARAQSRISSNQAAYGTLSAEFPAVISAVLADAGQVVAAGQPVFRVARPEEKEVQVAIPEGRLEAIRTAQNFAVHLWADPKTVIAGRLRELAAVADPQTRTYLARIQLIDPPAQVRLGMTARVTINEGSHRTKQPVLRRVPLAALGDQGKGPFVWVVQAGKLEQRSVQVGEFREDGATITAGLQAGETVVVAGISRLVAGQAVIASVAPPPNKQR
jgi:membrane fusion protein, multidrug efflux system